MKKSVRNFLAVLALPLGLAACGGSGDASIAAATAAKPFDQKFGDSFTSFFEASPTTADASVRHPTSADLPPLSLTTEPIDN